MGDSVRVKFKMEGPIFETGVPLLEVTAALQEFHSVVDKIYMTRMRYDRLTKKERKQYGIMATEFRRGSFEADLSFWISSTNLLPGILGYNFGPKDLWEMVKLGYDFLKILFQIRSTGIEPQIHVEGNNNNVIILRDNNIFVPPDIYAAADRAEPHLKKLASFVKKGKIDSISSLDGEGGGFVITDNEKRLFNPKTVVDKESMTVLCNIYRYDKESGIGKLRVLPGEIIIEGEYTFRPISRQNSKDFIIAMIQPSVKATVLKEIETHTSGATRISALHIISLETDNYLPLFDSAPVSK